ncbi:MAG TPA: DUF2061 domain-containing protein [bacterium]|nr:DUF2061 domain-containing protein [bacterium]
MAKSITWRLIASSITVILVYYFTGELALSVEIGVAELILKLGFYVLHDRAWEQYINNRARQ